MCGIVGILSDNGSHYLADIVSKMSQSLTHRGPDESGSWTGESIALGHRRLSIIDLKTGQQPMTTPDGRFTIVSNGEIYNYIELKQELEKADIKFNTTSDTEVLLNSFVHWGQSCLERLIGMFAFAVWDQAEQTLFVARDRVGKKPLLYFWDGHTFAFASELKALLYAPGCDTKLDPNAVELYFTFGYVPAPNAIFQNIKKLQPGHYLKFRDGQIEISCYWHPEHSVMRPAPTFQERVEEFRHLFSESIRFRLRSDVPIALFLSGGIDSSAVAAELVSQNQDLLALSVVFDQDETDLQYAFKAAKYLGLRHEVIEVAGNIGEDLERIFWHYDEPFADTSNIPSFYIASAARNYCKVVLTGDGGDEGFAGYRHYEYIALKQRLKAMACAVGLKDGNSFKPWHVYLLSKSLFRQKDRLALLNDSINKNATAIDDYIDSNYVLNTAPEMDTLHRALWADRHIQLPDDYLYKVDISLSAFGVEGRSPFLDHRLLEWAQWLPCEDLVVSAEKKILLKTAFRGILPDEILDRPKHGFGSPIANWLTSELYKYLKEYLPCPLLDTQYQKRLLYFLDKEKATSTQIMRIWTIFVFAIWSSVYRAFW